MNGATVDRGDLVVLLHGLFMRGRVMRLLAKRLEADGFRTLEIDYPSLGRNPEQNADALRDRLQQLAPRRVHFVAHSLGGIVLLHMLARWPECPPGRVVLLGSPVRGSRVARAIHKRTLLRPLLGRSIEAGLLGGVPTMPIGRSVGVITGSRRLGLGVFVHDRDEPIDGAVAERETLLDGNEVRLVLPHSHTGLLLSRRCGDACARFLRTGRFDPIDGTAVRSDEPSTDTDPASIDATPDSTTDAAGANSNPNPNPNPNPNLPDSDNPGERHGRT